MKEELKFRLVYTRGKPKNIMSPEFRSIIDIPEDIILKGTYEVIGVKERNGNIDVRLVSFYESEQDRLIRKKKVPAKPLSRRKKDDE
ncbi:MAG: hypothetical protein WAU36_04150 [Cyclobacteriaceae bacterium]